MLLDEMSVGGMGIFVHITLGLVAALLDVFLNTIPRYIALYYSLRIPSLIFVLIAPIFCPVGEEYLLRRRVLVEERVRAFRFTIFLDAGVQISKSRRRRAMV